MACITDLMVKEGLINLDFADVRAVMREMGKAMMGTGEATGEKRALRAAEAAISNPLIDDVSMKGARGLLISITGGKDLTLYEVDEAATRIREEVDQEANIIVGATFDESLEGITRVSVVATGIDHVAIAARPTAENRVAELTQKLRADTQRLTERIERAEQAPRARRRSRFMRRSPRASVEQAATAAVAAALQAPAGSDDVTIRPIAPKPSLFMEPTMAEPSLQETPKAFIPPQAERPRSRAPAHAAYRRTADPGAERTASAARRTSGRASREAPPDACCSASLRSGLGRREPRRRRTGAAAATRRDAADHRAASAAAADARARVRKSAASRCRNTPDGPRRRGSTSTAGRRLCTSLWMRISSKSRPSCAGRPTDEHVRNRSRSRLSGLGP